MAKLADSFSEGMFQLSLTQLDTIQSIEPVACGIYISWLWPTMINRQTSNATYSSAAYQYTLPDRSMPSKEADTAYQGCLPSCKLHSRPFWHCQAYRQSSNIVDCTSISHNLEIGHVLCNLQTACSISRFEHNLRILRMIVQILKLSGTCIYAYCMPNIDCSLSFVVSIHNTWGTKLYHARLWRQTAQSQMADIMHGGWQRSIQVKYQERYTHTRQGFISCFECEAS